MTGRVVLVGAGPGDPDLLTVRAVRELRQAEVLLYDALIDPVILAYASPGCERIDVGKRGDGSRGVAQDAIAELLIRHAKSGKHVVRLKGGDPFVFGRGAEEASALVEAGVPFEIVPGISSAIAVPAYAGIPVTDRRLSSSLAIVTGHRGKQAEDHRIDWEGLARSAETLIVMMGTAWLPDIVERVIASGRDPDTPAAVIAQGTTPQQRVVRAPLHALAERVREAGLRAPTIIVIGAVASFRETLSWFEQRPLFAKRVLVTRSEAQAGELALALQRRAAWPVCVPLLEFAPPEDEAALSGRLARASAYDWIVFTSSNTVSACADGLDPARLGGTRVACIGPRTAAAARRAGLPVHLVPPGVSVAESFVAAIEAEGPLRGRRVLLPRAEAAREAVLEGLRAAGAEVDAVVAYRTRRPAAAPQQIREALKRGLDAVTLTSPSTVDHLFSALSEAERDVLQSRATFACIGPTTADALARWTQARPVVAEEQSNEGLVAALERALGGSARPDREESDDLS